MMELASLNDSAFSDYDPLSIDEFKKLFYNNPYDPNEFTNQTFDFTNDGLYPYTNDSHPNYFGSGFPTRKNCSEQMDFLLEINKFFSPSQVIVPVIYSIICAVGLIGNGLVLFVIFGNKEMPKSVANMYIWNLAVADTLLLVSLPFTSTQRILLSWPFGDGMCKIVEAVKYLNYFASVFFLTAMSIDRYVAVVHVVKSSRWRTSRNTFYICSAIWIISLIMVIPLLIYTQVHGEVCALVFNSNKASKLTDKEFYDPGTNWLGSEYSDYVDSCEKLAYYMDYVNIEPFAKMETDPYFDEISDLYNYHGEFDYKNTTEEVTTVCKHPNSETFHVYLIFTFVIGFVIPFSVITICYIMIIVRLIRPSEVRTRSKQTERTRRKVTKMVVALVITFFICWLPFYVWHLIQIRGIKANIGICHNVRDFTFCLGYANSCLNPILYTFLGHNFRERLRKSIAISLRPFSFATFTKPTTNITAASRAETGAQSRKLDGNSMEVNDNHNAVKATPLLMQVKEEEEIPSLATSCNCSAEKLDGE